MKKDNRLVDAIGMIKDEFIEEAHGKRKWNFKVPWALIGKIASAAAVLLLVINIFPFGKNSASGGYSYNSGYDYKSDGTAYDEEYSYAGSNGGTGYATSNYSEDRVDNLVNANKKLILTAKMNVEIQNLDEMLENLNTVINKYGAYIQSSTSNTSGGSRQFDATIRIPSDKYEQFLEELKTNGNVSYYSEETKDVTDSYTDLEARIRSLKAQEEKVLEFYSKAESIDDLMAVESRLSDIRYEIDYLETQLKNYDLLISYSTLTLHVRETASYTQTSTSFGARLGRALKNGFHNFISSVEDIIIDLAYDIYGIVFIVAILALAYFIFRKIRNRKRTNA